MVHDKWKYFGSELRRLRVQSGLTQAQLAKRVKLSAAMVGALERATRVPRQEFVDAIDTVLATGGSLSRLWQDASSRRDVPSWFRDALSLEERASEIREFESHVVPGLLQTPEYATALETSQRYRPDISEVEGVVDTRTKRLANLRDRVSVALVIPGRALRHTIGDVGIMARQLTYLAKKAEEDVTVQLLEDAPGLSVRYPFRLMTLSYGTVAYVEHADGGAIVDHPERVARLERIYGHLQMEALPPKESLKLIKKLGDDYGSVLD